MKALTLHQPWAQFLALGVKTIETRSWATDYRGRLAIHAGAQRSHHGKFYLSARQALTAGRITKEQEQAIRYMEIPFGAIVASCELVEVVPIVSVVPAADRPEGVKRNAGHPEARIERTPRGELIYVRRDRGHHVDDELPYGDFTPGRFAWFLEDIKPVEERCPACWGKGWIDLDPAGDSQDGCRACADTISGIGGFGYCDPIPAKGKQRLWEWTL